MSHFIGPSIEELQTRPSFQNPASMRRTASLNLYGPHCSAEHLEATAAAAEQRGGAACGGALGARQQRRREKILFLYYL